MLNSLIIQGRLTRDPETRKTANDKTVCNFTIACDDSKSGGEKNTSFVDCEAWNATAEFIDRNFSKGRMILIVGKLSVNKWQDKKTGENRTKYCVVANSIEFCDGKSPKAAERDNTEQSQVANGFEFLPDDDDDMPF